MNGFSKNASVYLLFICDETEHEHVWGVYSNYMAAYNEMKILERVYSKPSMKINMTFRIEDFLIESD